MISGVPHGSILGPLLFILYINDIVHISTEEKFSIYADDTTIFVSAFSSDEVLSKANNILSKLDLWVTQNELKINPTKTKAILYHSKGKEVFLKGDILFRSSRIEVVNSVKILGVHFSATLQWDDQVNYLLKKLSSITGILNRNRYLLPETVKLLVYNALFASHLNYCHLVWGTTTETNLTRLLKVQKRILRVIANKPYTEPTAELFRKYKIMRVHNIYEYRLAREFSSSIRKNNPLLSEIASLRCNELSYSTRKTEKWNVPTSRTNYGLQMLINKLPRLLNRFDSQEIEVTSLSAAALTDLFIT